MDLVGLPDRQDDSSVPDRRRPSQGSAAGTLRRQKCRRVRKHYLAATCQPADRLADVEQLSRVRHQQRHQPDTQVGRLDRRADGREQVRCDADGQVARVHLVARSRLRDDAQHGHQAAQNSSTFIGQLSDKSTQAQIDRCTYGQPNMHCRTQHKSNTNQTSTPVYTRSWQCSTVKLAIRAVVPQFTTLVCGGPEKVCRFCVCVILCDTRLYVTK